MLFIAYPLKGQVHVFAGRVKTVSHLSCRTSAILKYFCPYVYFVRQLVLYKMLFAVNRWCLILYYIIKPVDDFEILSI